MHSFIGTNCWSIPELRKMTCTSRQVKTAVISGNCKLKKNFSSRLWANRQEKGRNQFPFGLDCHFIKKRKLEHSGTALSWSTLLPHTGCTQKAQSLFPSIEKVRWDKLQFGVRTYSGNIRNDGVSGREHYHFPESDARVLAERTKGTNPFIGFFAWYPTLSTTSPSKHMSRKSRSTFRVEEAKG